MQKPRFPKRTRARRHWLRFREDQSSSSELEKEHGKLIWSFDIAQVGSKNITEVQVDAKTGKIVSTKTETPDKERQEAIAEKKGGKTS